MISANFRNALGVGAPSAFSRTAAQGALVFPLALGMFHLFIFSFWYYWPVIKFVPTVLSTTLFFTFSLWIPRFIPFRAMNRGERHYRLIARMIPRPKNRHYCEIAAWYIVMGLAYKHLQLAFEFPDSLRGISLLRVLGIGYLTFFCFAALVGPVLWFLMRSFSRILVDIVVFRDLIERIFIVFSIYLFTDIFFAAIYRLLSFIEPKSFDPPLNSTFDSIYFSTVTIATVGYGDILPKLRVARLFVMLEILAGTVLLVGILSTTISLAMTEPPKHKARSHAKPKANSATES